MNLQNVRSYLSSGKSFFDVDLRVCIYARVSTESIEQKKSLVNQVEHFKEYISLNPNWKYISSYIDDGVSGTSIRKRNNFMRMIDDAKNGLFDLIITKEISRFSRNTLDSIKYSRLLLSYGVCVFFVSDNINTIYSDSELRLTIMSSLAQDEVRRLSERVKFGMNRAINRGDILGNDMLYGYKKNKNTGNLEIIENEAKEVREVFELFVYKKYSLGKIAKYMNTISNRKWYSTSVSRIMENPKYKGYYCGKKSSVVDYIAKTVEKIPSNNWVMYKDCGKIPPIVDESLWNIANKRLIERKMCKTSKVSYQDRYLYSGKIFCGNDNYLYYRRNKKNNIWSCSKLLTCGRKSCNSCNISEEHLEFIFNDFFNIFDININNIIYYLKNIYSECNSVSSKFCCLLKRQIPLYSKRNKLLELNINNLITVTEFLEKKKVLDEEINSIEKSIFSLFSSDDVICFDDVFVNIDDYFFCIVVSLLLNKIIVFLKDDSICLDVYLNYGFDVFFKEYLFDNKRYYINFYSYK